MIGLAGTYSTVLGRSMSWSLGLSDIYDEFLLFTFITVQCKLSPCVFLTFEILLSYHFLLTPSSIFVLLIDNLPNNSKKLSTQQCYLVNWITAGKQYIEPRNIHSAPPEKLDSSDIPAI